LNRGRKGKIVKETIYFQSEYALLQKKEYILPGLKQFRLLIAISVHLRIRIRYN
jgi:hypothetical protein